MNRDLILGIAASVFIHAGTFFSDRFIDFGAKAPPSPDVVTTDVFLEPPRFEPDEVPEKPTEPEEAKLTFVPPQTIDVPQEVVAGSFTQPVQPLPPDLKGLNADFSRELIDPRKAGPTNLRIFDPEQLDQIPRTRGFRAPPNYPFEMRRTGVSGEVLVDFLVDTEGNVLNARAVTSSHREFELSAVQAVSKWKFHPGRKDGANVVTHMQIPILFSLTQN